ncbi:hypothetical protein SEUCBS139899_002460 [Sporothrix eucalyptigena]|uniref:Rhodopsin domain-containing protein n=1 Tax=Sporothrix eucalyptigena TaxID=1812306 RepID=A0ABP0B482_9PEZI
MSSHVPGADPALDAQTRVPILIGTAIAFSIATSLVVILRMYTRQAIVRSLGIDDYTMLIAAILAIGVTISTILQAENGLGRHAWLVTDAETMVQLKSLFAGEVLYNLSQIFTKISFLLQYRRIFRDNLTRAICFWLILYLTLWGITQEFLVAFACIPVSIFIPSMASKCIASLVVWYLTSIMNIVTDFIIFMVPIPAIRNLRLPLRQKILVMSIFCLGFFTCIISIVRLFTLRAALNSDDGTWDNSPTSWWTTIELNCGILCSSIATLRPLIRKLSPGSGLSSGATGDVNTATRNTTGTAGNAARNSFKKGAGYMRHASPISLGDDDSGAYPMRHMNESQSGLKEDVLDGADGSQASYEYSRSRN